MENIVIDGENLTIDQVWKIANKQATVSIAESAIEKIKKAREFVIQAADAGKVIYGLTTGFGAFKDTHIPKEKSAELSRNIILSHSVSVGTPFPEDVVRAAMLVRLNSVIKGYSGVTLATVQTFADFLNKNICPYVPQQGSVGASGDLSPLCHIVSAMIGAGEMIIDGKRVHGAEGLIHYGLSPLVLEAKEGLALSNGTSVLTGQAALNIVRAEEILKYADISTALSLQAFTGTINPFFEKIQAIRPHPGQIATAKNIRQLCEGSELVDREPYYRLVQDSYALRCVPQVHGAVRDAFDYAKRVVEIEINSATDNPLIFVEDGFSLSGGNFHGEPIGIAMNTLAIGIAEIASISERRTAKMVDKNTNHGLPAFLIDPQLGGLNSGLMIPQYTAAALVSENKILAHPSSVDSIPTSANQEDHVSMASIGSRHAARIIENTRRVLAIEMLSAAQGLEFRDHSKLSPACQIAYQAIRSVSPAIGQDRELYRDIHAIDQLLASNDLLKAVEGVSGQLA